MTLGPFGFEALGFGYTDVTRKLDTSWAEIATAQDFDAIQWTGPKSDTLTIKGVLFPESFGGLASLNGIAAMAQAGLPLMLVSGDMSGGSIIGLVAVTGVEEDRSLHTGWGLPRKDAYQINVRRYPGAPSVGSIMGQVAGLFA